jgi:FAD/FMN-containing dehydrogenase
LEIINPVTAELIEGKKLYYVLVEYEDSSTWTIKDEKQIKEAWSKRDACYAVCVNAWYDQIEDPKIPEDKFEEFFKWFEDKNLPVFWHIGIWVLHPHFKQWQESLVNEMYELVQRLWWEVSWEHWIGRKKQSYVSDKYINENKNLKEKRDSNNVFWY